MLWQIKWLQWGLFINGFMSNALQIEHGIFNHGDPRPRIMGRKSQMRLGSISKKISEVEMVIIYLHQKHLFVMTLKECLKTLL